MLKQTSQRFGLLLLDEGEYYFEDFSCLLVPTRVQGQIAPKRVKGRLKLCSKSVLFDPEDQSQPVLKWPFSKITSIGEADLGMSEQTFIVKASESIAMLENNIIKPYTLIKEETSFRLSLVYGTLSTFLPKVLELLDISRLRLEEADRKLREMINDREAQFSFDPSWIEDLSEKQLMECTGSRVTPLVHNPGRILITSGRLYFQPFNNISANPVDVYTRDILRVVPRRHLLRHIGLEVFWSDGTSILFAFKSSKSRDDACRLLRDGLDLSREDEGNMLLKWQNGLISNYDYLVYLNSQADRTFNDLAQYPVFPWIIKDYESGTLDLDNPDTFRDLKKPIGALNADRLAMFRSRYAEMPGEEEGGDPKFLYGTHYSTPGYVLYYLVRDEPELMLRLQNGRFDAPDRLFDSIADAWNSVLTNPGDVKELIPEFYQRGRGRFLKNYKSLDLGIKQSGRTVSHVQLPPWAKNEDDFVDKCCEALESEYVSRNLHHWIDLIFGCKQRGKAAEDADNVFYYLTYEGAVDLDNEPDPIKRSAIEAQISEFGQTPKQLFTSPHPKRKGELDSSFHSLPTSSPSGTPAGGDGFVLDLLAELTGAPSEGQAVPASPQATLNETMPASGTWASFKAYSAQKSIKLHKDEVLGMCLSGDGSTMYTVSQDECLKVYSVKEERQLRSINVCHMALSACTLTHDEKNIILGSWDNNIYVYSCEYGRVLDTITGHDDAISSLTTMQLDGEDVLFSSSWDSTCKFWGLDPVDSLPVAELDGQHETEVSCAFVSEEGNMAVTGGNDGMVVLWDFADKYNPMATCTIPAHPGGVNAVQISPDNKSVVSVGVDHTMKVHDVAGGEVLHVAAGEELRCVATDGRVVLAGGANGDLRMWELVSGSELEYSINLGPAACSSPITSLLVCAGGETILTGRKNGSVVKFHLRKGMDSTPRKTEDQFFAGLNTP